MPGQQRLVLPAPGVEVCQVDLGDPLLSDVPHCINLVCLEAAAHLQLQPYLLKFSCIEKFKIAYFLQGG